MHQFKKCFFAGKKNTKKQLDAKLHWRMQIFYSLKSCIYASGLTSGSVKNTFEMRKKSFAGLENMEQCPIKTSLSSHTPLNYIILL